MKITIFGTGYVGLVTGACFAEIGNEVCCVDINAEKVAMLNRGETPIFEPGLSEMLQRNRGLNRISFTTSPTQGVAHGELIFIAVGTPPSNDGSADLRAVKTVAKEIGEHLNHYALIINKSTVPVGTANQVRSIIEEAISVRELNIDFDIASNPEFLREGVAIEDFMNPDRIIVGADTARAAELLRQLYTPLIDAGQRFVVMDTPSAELTKYASNAFLATKISFINEMSHIAERLGADIEQVRRGMSMDPRIGEHFLFAGSGYGGSCFPKDIQALQKTARDVGYEASILSVVEAVNEKQKRVLFEKINQYFHNNLKGKVIALWGLAFKPNTDDLRAAPSLVLIEQLLAAGATMRVHDPIALDNTKLLLGEQSAIYYAKDLYDALTGADTLAISTEWEDYTCPDFIRIKKTLRSPAIFDGRNIYSPEAVEQYGLDYFAIGRGYRLSLAEELCCDL